MQPNGVPAVIMNYEWRKKKCNVCSCWMHDFENRILHYQPDNDYPARIDPESLANGMLVPKRITYDNIQNAIILITNEILEANIKQSECKAYLKTFGINVDAQDQIIENAMNMKRWKDAEENKDDDPKTFREMCLEKEKFPATFEMFRMPSAWYHRTCDISVFADVPMHLLMLGVVKTIMITVGDWLRSLKKNSIFKKAVEGILNEIKSLNLEWCKILEYPKTDKTGGWVSENFAAMARLGEWFYSMIHFLFPEDIRQASIDSDRVVQPGQIQQLIGSMCLMIKTLMSSNSRAHDAEKLEALIRYFLINYDNVTDGQLNKGLAPWVTHYNMLCLLNLPDVLRQYGSMRNIWEGGMDGEAYVKKAKKKLRAGLVNQWQVWAIESLLKEEIYAEWKADTKESDIIAEHKAKLRSLCKVYRNYTEARRAYDSGKPFSCLQINTEIYLCHRDKGKIIGKLVVVEECIHHLNGMNYYKVTLKKKRIEFRLNTEPAYFVYVGALFLPYLNKTGYPNGRDNNAAYCFVKSDWSNP